MSLVTIIIHIGHGQATDGKHELAQLSLKSAKERAEVKQCLHQQSSVVCLHIHRFGVVLKMALVCCQPLSIQETL